MSNIFLNYSRKNEAIVRLLADDIGVLGHDVWFDQDLRGGQVWWDQILANIRDCEVFVFALSPEALNSTPCIREYRYAADLGKPILPVLVAEGVSMNLLTPALSEIQFVDYRKHDSRAVLRLARALNDVLLPDPLPEPPGVPISYLGTRTEQVRTTSALSYEEQSALVVDLIRGLRDPGTTDDARTLLERLRKRRDLFAKTAEEIDELLASTTSASSSSPSAPAEPEKPVAQEVKAPSEAMPVETPSPRQSPVMTGAALPEAQASQVEKSSAEEAKYFFSYSRNDSEFVLKLAEELREAGANLWLDKLDIPAGEHWDRAIERALKVCQGTIVVLSPASVDSDNVMDEVSFALKEKKQIIPILYQDCEIPLRIARIQYVDFIVNYDKGFTQLLRALYIE